MTPKSVIPTTSTSRVHSAPLCVRCFQAALASGGRRGGQPRIDARPGVGALSWSRIYARGNSSRLSCSLRKWCVCVGHPGREEASREYRLKFASGGSGVSGCVEGCWMATFGVWRMSCFWGVVNGFFC